VSLQTRFILIYGVGSVLFLTLLTVLIFSRMQDEMISQLKIQFNTDAKEQLRGLNQSLEQNRNRYIQIASVPMFRAMRFHQLSIEYSALQDDVRQLELYFLEQQMNDDSLNAVRFINTNGAEVLHIKDAYIIKHIKDVSNEPAVQKALQLEADVINVTVSRKENKIHELVWWVPVFISKKIHLGTLAFHVSFEQFKRQVLEISGSDREWLCVKEGDTFIIKSDDNACSEKNDKHWRVNNKLSLPGLAMNVELHADPSVFLVNVHQLRWLVFMLILPAVAILLLIVIVISSRKISGAVNAVVAAAQDLGSGEDFIPIKLNRQDELGQLAVELNRTAMLIQNKTHLLESSNQELEAYSYSIAHDLRAPVRTVTSFAQILEIDLVDKLNDDESDNLKRIIVAGIRMSGMIDDILELSKVLRQEIDMKQVDLSHLVEEVAENLKLSEPERNVEWFIEKDIQVKGDMRLLRMLVENLLTNAWKYSRKKEKSIVKFGCEIQDEIRVYFIRDNGAGFDMKYVDKLFKPFHRLHRAEEFEGSGVGLATVKRVIQRHQGKIWLDSKEGEYTIVYFTLESIDGSTEVLKN